VYALMASYNGTERSAGTRPDSALEVIECNVRATSTAADGTPPVVSNVLPVSGSTVAPGDALLHRVTDDVALRGVVVLVRFADTWETAYRGVLVGVSWVGSFSPRYSGSSIAAATGGYDFSLVRTGGWYGSFAVEQVAFDGGGNVNV